MEEINKKIDEMLRQLTEMEAKLQGYKVMIAFEKDKESYKKKKKTIVFDFDGVIHKGYEGWKDGTIYGEIDDDLLDYIYELRKEYYIVISSNRPADQIVEFMNIYCNNYYINLSFEVFNKDMEDNMYWTKDGVIGVTNQKPVGVIYIDDRGYRYRGLEDLKEYIDVVGVDLI